MEADELIKWIIKQGQLIDPDINSLKGCLREVACFDEEQIRELFKMIVDKVKE